MPLPPYDYTRTGPVKPYDYSQPFPPPPVQAPMTPEPPPVQAPPPEEPEMSYPARDALLEYAKSVPQYEQPGWFNRVIAGAAGGSEGYFRGGAAGAQAAQNVLMTPYRQAVERWKVGLQPLESAARVENVGLGYGLRGANLDWQKEKFGKTMAFNKQKQAALEAWRASKQKSESYEGTWKFDDFIDPTGETHNMARNTRSNKWVEFTDAGEIASKGPGTGWNPYTAQVRTAISPESNIMLYDPAKMMRPGRPAPGEQPLTSAPALAETGVKVAEPVTWGMNANTGAMTGRGLSRSGEEKIARPAGSVAPPPTAPSRTPGPVAPPTAESPEAIGARIGGRTPKTEARLSREDEIQHSFDQIAEMKRLWPEVKKEMDTLKGSLKAYGIDWAHPLLVNMAEKAGIQISPAMKNFVTIGNDLSAAEVKKRSGVAFKDWELAWVTKSVPTYRSPDFASSLRRYERGLQIMAENRGMTSEAQLDAILDKEMPKQEQKLPQKWFKKKSGEIWVENPETGNFRPAQKGFVGDDKFRVQ